MVLPKRDRLFFHHLCITHGSRQSYPITLKQLPIEFPLLFLFHTSPVKIVAIIIAAY